MAKRGKQDNGFHQPFEKLGKMLDRRLPDVGATEPPYPVVRPKPKESDRALFRRSMADVTPLEARKTVAHRAAPVATQPLVPDCDSETLQRLYDLVQFGDGFVVADTPEYIEGTGSRVSREIARRLHNGEYSIQAHIDLHGLTVREARSAVDDFLKESIDGGKRAVLIVHGRGLSSPDEPVLKGHVQKWLSSGPWRKWMLAYASARLCDGGAGATYVLLRQRPKKR